ncbi:YqaA family protein [Vibrio sp. B1Z05]|uniref:YqaA family protein n=1 Tax=Vibrio sp. B1Z05 TaxID=2654980 RepID=UPI001320A868|nr:DedA family protein [Vibrio sp. B1Z05]
MDAIFAQLDTLLAGSTLTLLFVTGFLSATILPGGSEAALLGALSQHQHPVSDIIIVATLGNTLGGLTNYWIGLWIPNRTQGAKHGHKAIAWLHKYGYWTLLFSWAPIIGDTLCLTAGWLRMRFLPCLLLITFGKLIRYVTLVWIFTSLSNL